MIISIIRILLICGIIIFIYRLIKKKLNNAINQLNETPATDNSELFICCQEDNCLEDGTVECRLDDDSEPEYYCPEHAKENGFCYCCGDFWDGTIDWDRHPGLCPNCYDEIRCDFGEDQEDESDYNPDLYFSPDPYFDSMGGYRDE